MGMDKAIEKKKGLKKKHIPYILGAILFGVLFWNLIFTENVSTFKVEKDKISIGEVTQAQFNDYIRITGLVEPITTIYLDAVEGGMVAERLIDEGSMVKKGDVILKLENRSLYQTILNSEAQLAQKENFLRTTFLNMEREKIDSKTALSRIKFDIIQKKRLFEQNKSLYADELISKDDFLKSKENVEMAEEMLSIEKEKAHQNSLFRQNAIPQLRTDLERMRQNLKMVQERIDNLNVRAPVDGQLGMLDAEVGQSVAMGQSLGMVNVLTNFKIEALIDEHYIDRVRRNLTASFERQGKDFKLKVKKVYPDVRDGQFKIDMVFTGEKPGNIRTGQTHHVRLELGESQQAKMIPRGGFFQSTGGQWIYVLDPSETFAVKRNIRIGKQNPQFYEVIEGLESNEKVVISSYDTFGDNDKLILK